MTAASNPPVHVVMQLLERLGDVPSGRVRFNPVPGTATADDLLSPDNWGCELVDGTLVEKAVSFEASQLGFWLATLIGQFVVPRNLGIVTGEQGYITLADGLVRAPDVTFVSWGRLPGRRGPRGHAPRLSPDLAVEVLSPSNTAGEMARKRVEYFGNGTSRVWMIDPLARWVRVYTDPDTYTELIAVDTLGGDPVLPGFTLKLADLFAELDRHG